MATMLVIPVSASSAASFDGPFSGLVTPSASDGSLSIDVRDLPAALMAGFLPALTRVREAAIAAPAAALATLVVHSSTTANGALSISAQPDVARQLSIVMAPGSPGITAGSLAVTYVANDGTLAQVDTFSLIGATTVTKTSSKGAMHVASAVVSGLVGGTSPTVEIGTNATLAVPVPAGAQDATILKEGLDGADVGTAGTLTNAGLYTPNTAPNATHNYLLDYTYLAAA